MKFKPVDPSDLPDSTPITPAASGCIAKIVVDKREMRCAVSKEIDRMRVDLKDHRLFSLLYGQFPDAKTSAGIDLEFRTLSIGDYVLSDRVGVERKTTEDFLKTLLERHELFSQLMDLKMAYRRPLLVVEGEGGQNALFTSRMIDPASIWGILEAITIGFHIPILYTNDCAETARILCQIAVRQQTHERRPISLHGKRSHMTRKQLQEYVISSIPDVGPVAAERLLRQFGSVEGVINATKKELLGVDRIGPKIAEKMRMLLSAEYVSEEGGKHAQT
ncbi:MAG: helix-hairpin-helix domain-containing protein (plasmid) [Candidatus Methanoperedens sp.]|nr:MAG: helix-hairpin-helix domain-containing protein [Candidatus Methanoperedens sp.]